MARTFNGSTQYIEAGSAIHSTVPISICGWFYPSNNTALLTIASVAANGGSANEFRLTVRGDVVGDPVEFATVTPSANQSANAGTIATNVWQHACGVSSATNNRRAYLNGVGGTVGTANVANPASLNVFDIGVRRGGALNSYFSGRLAEVAVWTAALDASEIVALAKGLSPARIRPQNLAFYAPLVRDVVDVRGGLAMTDTGTTVGDHPRIYR